MPPPNSKIYQLPDGGAIRADDDVPVSRGGSNYRVRSTGYFSSENKDASPFAIGQPVGAHPSGSGLILATANNVPAVGLSAAASSPGATSIAKLEGKLSLTDWSGVTGASALVPLARYYISATPGMLTTTPDSTPGKLVQLVGVALDFQTISISPQPPILL